MAGMCYRRLSANLCPENRVRYMNRYLELILYRAYADLKAEAARGYLGVLWWIIEPLLYLGMFSVYFIYVRQQHDGRLIPFLLIGLVAWKWFASSIPHCARSIASGVSLMQQVYLPKYVFPCVAAATNLAKFLMVFILLLAALPFFGAPPTAAWLTLPLLVAAQFFLILSSAGLLAAVFPFLPDLNYIINNLLMLLFFLSGVLFDLNKMPESFRPYLSLNPLAVLIADYRTVLLDGEMPGWWGLAGVLILSGLLWAAALRIMHRFDRIYPKVLVR